MIKKLRIRFVINTMILVSIILVVMFTVLVLSFNHRMVNESNKILDAQYSKKFRTEIKFDRKNSNPFYSRSPFTTFFLQVDDDNNVIEIFDESNLITEEIVNNIFEKENFANDTSGTILSYKLRYKKFDDNIIGFIDYSYQNDFISKQIVSYALVFFITFIILLVISIYLSKLTVKPIETAWKKQQQFISDASHELKTPITVMRANTSILLSDSDIQENSKKWITNIDNETKHMQILVDDLLMLARMDTENYKNIFEEFSLSDTVYESTLPFEPVFFETGHTLNIDIEHDIKIYGSVNYIKRLIIILLDNAKKYSYENSEITIYLKKESNRIVLSVHNYGEIIANEDIDHIFDRFFIADKSRKREGESHGLGLSIAKEIADMHSAKIFVESSGKMGTTFSVIFKNIQ